MKRKKILFILLPILFAFILGSSFLIFSKKDDIIDDSMTNQEHQEQTRRKIYLLSNDNIIVPVTVSFDKKQGLAEELYYVVSLLKEDSNIHSDLKGVINKNTSITELVLKDKSITVGFSKEFLDYTVNNELRIIESIVWTLSQYDEIDCVNIKVDGELLTKMPLGKTPLPKDMNKDIGINNHVFPGMLAAKRVVTYYVKKIGNNEFYVPVSNNLNEDSVSVFLELSKAKTPIIYGLKVSKYLRETEIVSITENDNIIEFELTTSCLIEENLVDYDVFHALQVSISSYKEDSVVSITINGDTLMVDGMQDNESIPVSDVLYNEIVL